MTFMSPRYVGILLVLLLLGPAMCIARTSPSTTDTDDFTVTFGPGTWRGQPTLQGYVYNKRGMRATHLRLRIDTLDAAGAVMSSEVRPLDRDINPNDRAFFQFALPAGAPAYRVTVDYVFWRPKGGLQ